MKKRRILSTIIIATFLITLILTTLSVSPIFAQENQIKVFYNNEYLTFPDIAPFIDESGRTQVPIRFISEALGANVSWDSKTETVTINLDENTIILTINKKEYRLNGVINQMDTVSQIKNGRTFVPLRFISEAFGLSVKWDSSTKNIKIAKQVMPDKVAITVTSPSYMVNGVYTKTKDIDPIEMPNMYEGHFLVPIEQLADIFNGSYKFNSLQKTAVLNIDSVKFEFEVYSDIVKINEVSQKMPYETRLDHGIIKVPAKVFVGNLNNYHVKMLDDMSIIMKNKSIYDSDGKFIGAKKDNFEFTSYVDKLNNWSWGKSRDSKSTIKEINKMADEIISEISYDGMTDYEKILAVNQYMIDNIEYDDKCRDFWDAFLQKKAVCSGFAYGTGLLLEKMGVKNIYVEGYADVDGYKDIDFYDLLNFRTHNGHAWNIVCLNGKYYHLDTTWNEGNSKEKQSYNYFLLSDEQIMNDHAWNEKNYPSCDIEYDEKIIKELTAKGFSVISGKISSKEEVENVLVKIITTSSSIRSEKYVKISGSDPINFSMVFNKNTNQKDLKVSFVAVRKKLDGNFDTIGTVSVKQTGSYYDVFVNSILYDEVKLKVFAPKDLFVDKSYSFEVKINILEPEKEEFTIHGRFDSGNNETLLQFNSNLFKKNYKYTLEYEFHKMFLDDKEMDIPFINKGFIDDKGNHSPTKVTIDGNKIPLKNMNINFSKNTEYKSMYESKKGTVLNGDDIKELKDILIDYNYGNHDITNILKADENIITLENEQPYEIDSKGTHYYSITIPNGANIFRSYNLKQKNYSSFYSITLNNLDITESNFKSLFNEFNTLLADSLKTEVKIPYILLDEEIYKQEISDADLYEKITKGYAQYNISYTVDDFVYLLHISSSGSRKLASIGYSAIRIE